MQGVDGVEQGRLVGGIETEEEPHEAGKAEGQQDGERGNRFNLTDSGIVPVLPLSCPCLPLDKSDDCCTIVTNPINGGHDGCRD